MIKAHAHLVERVALRTIGRLPRSVELDDIKSAGMIGLIDAVDKYSEDKGSQFKVYAEIRIRGAIMDELRALDWVPRSVREHNTLLKNARSSLIEELGRPPTLDELAQKLNLTAQELERLLRKAQLHQVIFYEDMRRSSDRESIDDPLDILRATSQQEETPDVSLLQEEELEQTHEALKRLPERLRVVVSLYYFEDLKLKEIGDLLGVTESRVSQLLTQALKQLRETFSPQKEST
jgi:RNA polymerase sigma factor for flagellar operon FliA